MKSNKALGPDDIPIEAWKCLGKKGVAWLTRWFCKILLTRNMPDEWRKSILVPIYKNKVMSRIVTTIEELSLCVI